MKISLIIPTAYTPEPYFSNCMQRVKEETKDKDFEVIISEDGGKNITDEMRAQYPEWAIVLKHEEPSGCGQARKRAQEICTGDVVCFLDSDDLMARGYYDLIKDAWENHPDAYCIEFGFNNINPNGSYETYFCDDPEAQTYGHFGYEMVWNKSYKGENVRAATPFYNPPLMMTPAEDLLWNTVYQSLFNFPYEHERKILLDRIVRSSGLAWSTAADVNNRIKMMEYSMEVAKKISVSAPIYMWILTYVENLKNNLRKGITHCSGYNWRSYNTIPAQNLAPVTFHILHECNQKCSYCVNGKYGKYVKDGSCIDSAKTAEKLLDAMQRWDKLYGLPNIVTLSGGEPTLLDKEEMRKVFDAFPETLFMVFTNGYNLKDWLDAFDNVVFRVHSIDGKVNVEWLESDKVYTYCYVGEDENDIILKAWMKLKEKYPKILPLTNILKRTTYDKRLQDLCRKVEGVWCIDITVDEPLVSPCCGFNSGCHGTIENRPHKYDVQTCSRCTNPTDNYSEV